MKKLFLVIAMVFAMTGCFNEVKSTKENVKSEIVANTMVKYSSLVTIDPTVGFSESFEGTFNKYNWGRGGVIYPAIQTYIGYGSDNMYSCRFDNRYMATGEISYIELDVIVSVSSKIKFYTVSNVTPDISTVKLLVDGVESLSFDNPHTAWTEWNTSIPTGRHMLRFEMKRTAGAYDANKRYLWVDAINISADATPTPVPVPVPTPVVTTPTPIVVTPEAVVVPTPVPVPEPVVVVPTVTSLTFTYPVSPLKAIAGVTKIACKVSAKKSDGSLKTDAVITYSTFGPGSGTVDANGVFTGTTPGLCNVVAKYNGLTANSKTIEVLPANYIDLPFVYNGVTYNGKTSVGTGTVVNPDAGIKITAPTTTTFDADGFFTLKGSVSYTGADRYVWVSVNKPGVGGSSYYLEGNFATRIWLRCGAGSYTVKVVKIQDRSNNLNYTGDMTSFALGATLTTFTVNNTRNEDGKFYYPSYWLQSDDISIYNKAMELTYAKTAINDKIRALHDWTCAAMTYDNSSLTAGKRKKQDAISALNTGSVVCEGYTSIYNAMLRSIGIKAKAVAGNTAAGLHAWTNVLSGSTWYFVDTTWDDNNTATPMTRYFMLTSLNGINNDHVPTTERIERSGIVRIGLTEND